MENIIIVAAQLDFLVGDIKGNTERIIAKTKEAQERFQADLVVFSELALTGYPPEDLLLRQGFYRRCREAMHTIIAATGETAIVVGYPDHVEGKSYNKAAIIQNGKIIGDYAKQDLPNYTVFDEKRYFTPGSQPCVVKIKGLKIGITICEDLWHPGPAKQSVDAGAQIIVSPNASPYDRHKVRARESMLAERAAVTRVPFIYVNCVGGQDELVFDGGSMVVNADGERVQQAKYYEEELMPIEVIPNKHVEIVSQKLPPRISEEENIYKTLVLGVRDYVRKNHFPGAIIGLSGGIDSALTAAIAMDALGSENVHTVMMPSRFTTDISREDAQAQAKTENIEFDVIDIDPIYKTFLKALKDQFAGKPVDTTEENLQARIRGTLLMGISNKKGYIVLTTGNKSELSVGYATLYGDMAGGFAVLKDIPKTLVYRLAQYRNLTSPLIPERVLEREPSAELAEDQKDQDSLPPYSILDQILELYIEKDADPIDIYEVGLDKDTVNRVIGMINANEYKRRQAPIGIRVTQRAFGKDRRYPITSGYSRNI